MTLDAVKAAVLVTLVAIVQVAFVNVFELVEGRADVLLLVVVSVALLRGPLFGACAGFWTGLVVDTMTLGTLGLTSLLLTLAGYAAGRFGEATSSRGSQRARVLIAVTIVTLGVGIGSLVVHVLLGEPGDPALARAQRRARRARLLGDPPAAAAAGQSGTGDRPCLSSRRRARRAVSCRPIRGSRSRTA